MRRGISTAIFAVALCAAAPPALSDISSDVAKSLEWRQVGPFRGGWATMADGIPSQPDVFYFAAAGGGIWRTVDAGRTWSPLFQHGPAASVAPCRPVCCEPAIRNSRVVAGNATSR